MTDVTAMCLLSTVTSQQETKVTKRSFEAPEPGKYGTSEYARIATASEGGIVSSVPQV
jgi:hypothetical protein